MRRGVLVGDGSGEDGDIGPGVDEKNTAGLLIKDGQCSEAAGRHSSNGGSAGSY